MTEEVCCGAKKRIQEKREEPKSLRSLPYIGQSLGVKKGGGLKELFLGGEKWSFVHNKLPEGTSQKEESQQKEKGNGGGEERQSKNQEVCRCNKAYRRED